jgi:hypothetical protein
VYLPSQQTGRRRKKKCDEATPTCHGCEVAGHDCIWPAQADTIDRRFASHSQSRHHGVSAQSKTRQPQDNFGPDGSPEGVNKSTSQSTGQAMVNNVMSESLEIFVFRHFLDKYCRLILLPWCHRSFREGWQNEILRQIAVQKFLYYSAMACAASHIYLTDDCEGMHQLSLWFYSNAVTRLGSLLMKNPRLDHDGLFSSVLLLTIHGV